MRSLLLAFTLLAAPALKAQTAPASPVLLTLGPIDAESDQKQTVITMRFDTKPGFTKPVVEAHGSFLEVQLPHTMVLKPNQFMEAKSPYIRKFAAFQIDEDHAALRLFVTKEAEYLLPAASVDILENRVIVIIDHAKAEKELDANFSGVPVQGGPTPEQVAKSTVVRNDIPDPIGLIGPKTKEKAAADAAAAANAEKAAEPAAATAAAAPASAPAAETEAVAKVETKAAKAPAAPAAKEEAKEAPRWADSLESKLVAVTIFVALMLLLLIALKSWRKVAAKTIAPGSDFSLKTLATHALGPKQRITVIQVGSEQILLGVSPDSINFLTALNRGPNNGMQMSMPQSIDSQVLQRTLSPAPKRAPRAEGLAEPLAKSRAEPKADNKPEPGSSIRYGVGDAGIKNFKDGAPREQESFEDVTRMIRKKLKDLPKV